MNSLERLAKLSTEELEQLMIDYPHDEESVIYYLIILMELKRREILEKQKIGIEDEN